MNVLLCIIHNVVKFHQHPIVSNFREISRIYSQQLSIVNVQILSRAILNRILQPLNVSRHLFGKLA